MTAPTLSERLRTYAAGLGAYAKLRYGESLMLEAAAEIERQAAELARLTSQLEAAGLAKPAPSGFLGEP